MKKIFIVEDEENIRDELKILLDNSGYETQVINDFKNAKEEILSSDSDLVLLDINIPYLNGEELLKLIRKESDVPVIMVTSKNSEVDEVLSITYGADDYITKPYNPTLLILRIQNIFKRTSPTQSDTIDYMGVSIDLRKSTMTSGTNEIILTKNEMIILSYLLNHKGCIVSRDELMTDLWNNSEYLNDNALTVNISRLRSKLKDIGIDDAIETRKNQGYILKD